MLFSYKSATIAVELDGEDAMNVRRQGEGV